MALGPGQHLLALVLGILALEVSVHRLAVGGVILVCLVGLFLASAACPVTAPVGACAQDIGFVVGLGPMVPVVRAGPGGPAIALVGWVFVV